MSSLPLKPRASTFLLTGFHSGLHSHVTCIILLWCLLLFKFLSSLLQVLVFRTHGGSVMRHTTAPCDPRQAPLHSLPVCCIYSRRHCLEKKWPLQGQIWVTIPWTSLHSPWLPQMLLFLPFSYLPQLWVFHNLEPTGPLVIANQESSGHQLEAVLLSSCRVLSVSSATPVARNSSASFPLHG